MSAFFDNWEQIKQNDDESYIFRILSEAAKQSNTSETITDELNGLNNEAFQSSIKSLKKLAATLGYNIKLELEEKDVHPQSLTYSRIALALSQDYFVIYYIDIETDNYIEFSSQGQYEELHIEERGEDFFSDCHRNIMRVVYDEDKEKALSGFKKEYMLSELKHTSSYSLSYRLMLEGEPVYVNAKVIRLEDGDDRHIIIGVSNIDAQMKSYQEYESVKEQSVTYARIAQSLSQDYYSVYYVDTKTNDFTEYSTHGGNRELKFERNGVDFFNDCKRSIPLMVYKPDQEKALSAFDRENLLRELDGGKTFTISYRFDNNGEVTYANLKAIRVKTEEDDHIIIGISNIDAQMKSYQEYEATKQESLTYSRIAQALSKDYFSIYYVNMVTDRFIEYSSHSKYRELQVERSGDDFFSDCRRNIMRVVYEDDRDIALSAFEKANLERELEKNQTFSVSYRLVFDGVPVYVNLKAIKLEDEDSDHIVIGVNNIDAQIKRQEEYEREKEQTLTYSRIAQALSRDYFGIYYIDTETDNYIEYSSQSEYQTLEIEESGDDFFADCRRNVMRLVYKKDQERVLTALEKNYLMRELEGGKTFSMTYRLMFDDVPVYISLKAILMENEGHHNHIIIGISNIDAQKKREELYAIALDRAQEIANRDALTGVKSKHAYNEAEQELNELIGAKEPVEFAIVVCDVNGLKLINDTLGHKAGDWYIQEASSLICSIFKHSPVYRIGGDEFVVTLQGNDYKNRGALIKKMKDKIKSNKEDGKVVIACGISIFDPAKDTEVLKVFERADSEMYINKKDLKSN